MRQKDEQFDDERDYFPRPDFMRDVIERVGFKAFDDGDAEPHSFTY